jgi:hypothetical protein
MKKTITIAALSIATSVSAQMTGNQLHQMCISQDLVMKASCFSLIAGFSYGVNAAQIQSENLNKNYKPTVCLPDGYQNRQAVDLVKKFLDENPQHRHHQVDPLMMAVMQSVFPCK